MISWPKPDEYGYDNNGFKKRKQNIIVNQWLKQTKQNQIKLATWRQIQQQGVNTYNRQGLKRLIREGIPDSLRRSIWPYLIMGPTPKYQDVLKQPYDEKIAKIIDLDLERTFPDNINFYKNQKCYDSLRRVLVAISTVLPELGYCQGLNFIVATILLRLAEQNAFAVTYNILRYLGHGKLLTDIKRVKIDLFILDKLVEKHFKQFYQHLKTYEVDSLQYGTSWFITLFCGCLPFEYNLRIIQLYLNEGKKILFRTALTILKYKKHRAKQMNSFQNTLIFLKNFDDFSQIPAEQFVKQMFNFNVSKKQLEMYEDLYSNS